MLAQSSNTYRPTHLSHTYFHTYFHALILRAIIISCSLRAIIISCSFRATHTFMLTSSDTYFHAHTEQHILSMLRKSIIIFWQCHYTPNIGTTHIKKANRANKGSPTSQPERWEQSIASALRRKPCRETVSLKQLLPAFAHWELLRKCRSALPNMI